MVAISGTSGAGHWGSLFARRRLSWKDQRRVEGHHRGGTGNGFELEGFQVPFQRIGVVMSTKLEPEGRKTKRDTDEGVVKCSRDGYAG